MTIVLTDKQFVWATPDGTIVCTEIAPTPTANIPGATMLVADLSAIIDHARHKVVGGELVERSETELLHLDKPRLEEVSFAIARELRDTDPIVLVKDFPAPKHWQGAREEYIAAVEAYRVTLRDLSKNYSTVEDYVNNWPLRPDGSDAIPLLRRRI